jgi:hypothetical protein
MRRIFLLFSLSIAGVVNADSQWSLSLNLGIPELMGLRIIRYTPKGSYFGFQPGALVTIPAHLIVGNDTWAFTPGIFAGSDVYVKGPAAFTIEVDITHGMSWGKYEDGGGFLVAPRCGLTVKKNRLLLRFLGGVTFLTFETLGLPSRPRALPSFLIEGGIFLDKSGWRFAEEEKSTLDSVTQVYRSTQYSPAYHTLKERRHVLTVDPLGIILKHNVGLAYYFGVTKRTAIGINPQLAISDYSTIIGGAIATDFYFKKVFYGWHMPVFAGIIPANIKFTQKNYYSNTSSTVTDAVYAFCFGTGIGFNWCFKPGFVINPGASIGYANFLSEPTQEFKDKVWNDFGENYDDFENSIPPILFGLGIAIGWAF